MYAEVAEEFGQTTLSEPSIVEVVSNGNLFGGGGSMAPKVDIVYPKSTPVPSGNEIITTDPNVGPLRGEALGGRGQIFGPERHRPLTHRTSLYWDDTVPDYVYTSTSRVRLFAGG